MRFRIIAATILLPFLCVSTFAQTPVPFGVTAITVTKQSTGNQDGFYVMYATSLPAPFKSPVTGWGETLLMEFENCRPCFLRSTFLTSFGSDGPPRFVAGFYPNGSNGNTRVRFIMAGTSDDLVLNPRLSRKKNPLVMKGQAMIQGKIEVMNNGIVVAVDNDVNLSGSYTAEVWNYLLWNTVTQSYRRAFDYKGITFSYAQ